MPTGSTWPQLGGSFEGILKRLKLVGRHARADAPGICVANQARLRILTARTHYNRGEIATAGQIATEALAEATKTGDMWATGWALHVLTMVTVNHGKIADALPLFDRALAITQSDPALIDLQLLLQINHAVALGDLDQYDSALAAAREARQMADRAGLVVRQIQAHSALGQLLFNTGRWDDAIAEVGAVPDDINDPSVACCDHGVAAVISFHRRESRVARHHLAAAAAHAERIGNRVNAALALARSLDAEHRGEPTKALAVLTAGFANNAEELDEMEDLLADAVRLAVKVGDVGAGKALACYAETLAIETEIPHRHANALYCRGVLDHDPARLLRAAEWYRHAHQPLPRAKALEEVATILLDNGDRSRASAAVAQAIDIYASLNATRDAARLRTMYSTRSRVASFAR